MRSVSWLVLAAVFSAVSCGNISAPEMVPSDKSSVKKEVVLAGPVFQFPTANRELLNDGGEIFFFILQLQIVAEISTFEIFRNPYRHL